MRKRHIVSCRVCGQMADSEILAAHTCRLPAPLSKEARASVSIDKGDGATQSGCPTCGACSPPMTAAERDLVESALEWWGVGSKILSGKLPLAIEAVRAERSKT